jgi:hypothetical protein
MHLPNLEQFGCLDSACSWRREAGHQRTLAAQPHLGDPERQTLLREAEAADRQAAALVGGCQRGLSLRPQWTG